MAEWGCDHVGSIEKEEKPGAGQHLMLGGRDSRCTDRTIRDPGPGKERTSGRVSVHEGLLPLRS